MFWLRKKKITFLLRTLNLRHGTYSNLFIILPANILTLENVHSFSTLHTSIILLCVSSRIKQSVFEIIKLEYSLKLKIKRNGWLLADTCPQAATIVLYFEFENELKF